MLWVCRVIGCAVAGLIAAYKSEFAFRLELLLAAALLPVAAFIAAGPLEFAVMAFSLMLVLITELVNSAIETTVNRISTEIHPLSKKAKDIASAAVFMSLINCALVWSVILFF